MEQETAYQKMYLTLFNHVTTAIRELDRINIGLAKEILIDGQQKAEEIFLEAGSPPVSLEADSPLSEGA